MDRGREGERRKEERRDEKRERKREGRRERGGVVERRVEKMKR